MFQQVESKSQGEDGWLFVPLLSMISLFQAHVWLEGFVRQNPANPDSNRDDNDKQECELQADEVSQKIQRSIDVLTSAYQKWSGMDLGPIRAVLGDTPLPEPTPPPPPEPTPPPPPVEYNYAVEVLMRYEFPILTPVIVPIPTPMQITVNFKFPDIPPDLSGNLATFAGYADLHTPNLPFAIYSWKGTAKLKIRADVLAGVETTFNFSHGPDGMNLNIGGIGHILSDEKNKSTLPGAGAGKGKFSR